MRPSWFTSLREGLAISYAKFDSVIALTQRLIREGCSTPEAFRRMFAELNRKQRSPLWAKLAAIPIDEDLDRLTVWFRTLLVKEPPPPSINGFWFGLVEMSRDGWTLYASGCKGYRVSNEKDWAIDPAWWPDGRYAKSSVMKAMSALRPKNDYELSFIVEMWAMQSYALLAIAEVLRRSDPLLVLGKAKKRGAACGFDDGDFYHVGLVNSAGFQASKR